MSGHSKWKNIMHKKEKTDAQRAKVFTKIGKEIVMAVKEGGTEPASNSRLRDLITKAKSFNVPNDNIERIIKKASGADSAQYEVVYYEGYAIGGVAVIVETTTDNRNRTAADIRHFFDKYGGNLGTTGCVSFMFADTGVVVVDPSEKGFDGEALMEDALECGAQDIELEEESAQVYTAVAELGAVRDSLTGKGYKVLSAEITKIPSTYVGISKEQTDKIEKFFDALEDNDDVTNYWHNLEE